LISVAIAACVVFAWAGTVAGQVAEQPAKIKVRMIVVETAERGDEVLRRLEAGESFTALAKELSVGPNAEAGGYIGTVATAELEDELRNALIGVRVGEHTGLVRTSLGFSIVELTTDEYYEAGVQLYEMGQFAEAASQLQHDITLNPDSALSYVYLGLSHAALNELDSAIEAYLKAIDLNPHIPEAYYDLGNAYRRAEQSDKAGAMYQKAIEVKPDFAAAHNNLAWLYAEEGEHLELGIEHAQRATDLAPNNPVYLETLAQLHYLRGDYDKAIDHIERAIRLDFKSQHYKDELARFQRAAAGEEPEKPVAPKEPEPPSIQEAAQPQEPAPAGPVATETTDQEPAEMPREQAEPQREAMAVAQIEVLNGTSDPAAAESLAALLRQENYAVAHVGTADRSDWARTTLLYRKDYLDLTLEIAHKIKGNQDLEELKTPSEYDIVIVVGKD